MTRIEIGVKPRNFQQFTIYIQKSYKRKAPECSSVIISKHSGGLSARSNLHAAFNRIAVLRTTN